MLLFKWKRFSHSWWRIHKKISLKSWSESFGDEKSMMIADKASLFQTIPLSWDFIWKGKVQIHILVWFFKVYWHKQKIRKKPAEGLNKISIHWNWNIQNHHLENGKLRLYTVNFLTVLDDKPTKSVGLFEENKISVGCHQFLLDCCPKLTKNYNFGQIVDNKRPHN